MTNPAPVTAKEGVGFRSERGPVLIAVILCSGLIALDSTIIATAVPSVVGDLGGFSQFPWLFSIYLLTQAVTVPLYGKFADVLGRRPVMFFGIAAFLLGSVLCGAAWSMPVLIAARAVQGIGAGAIQPIALTMVGDMYTVEERARVQGYLASVWAISSVVGPTLGGVFAEYLDWRWIFTRRTLIGGNLIAVVVGMLLMGLTSYLPTYAQGVLGTGALVAGFALAALTVGWPISASLAGRVYIRIGFRDTALIGSGIVIAGTGLTTLLSAGSSIWMAAGSAFVLGTGLGLASSPTLVAVQSTIGWERRGVVTATNMFSRSLGSAIGVAMFGAIANATLADRFAHPPAGVAADLPSGVDATSVVVGGSGEATPTTTFVRDALADATHHVFLAMLVVAVLSVFALLLMPRRTEELKFD